MNSNPPETYDGFYFVPDKNKNLTFHFFEKKNPTNKTIPIENKYHIGLYSFVGNMKVKIDLFEAVLGDAFVYASNLTGLNIAGILLKKTTDSESSWKSIILSVNHQYIGDGYEIYS